MLGVVVPRARFLVSRCQKHRHKLSLSTYYDSQSGLHIPVHNEQEISLFLNKSREETSTSSFVPAHLYKEDASSDMPDTLQELMSLGIRGVILPPANFPRDVRNLETLSNIAPSEFMFFSSMNHSNSQSVLSSKRGLSAISEYSETTETNDLKDSLKAFVENGIKTTISIRETVYGEKEPISVANQIAQLIDLTGGVDFLLVCAAGSSDNVDADDVVRLCEELVYLDIAGATIKSRMVVDSSDPEIVEETMFSGVNKFVIEHEGQVPMVEEIAKEQGKAIRR